VQRTIEGHIVEIEPDDPVERGERFGLERVEHPGVDPLVAAPSQGRVGHLVIEDRFDVDPRRSGHQADEDPSEAQPVRHAGPVTAEWVSTTGGSSGSTARQMASATSGSSARMMMGSSTRSSGLGSHPASKPGQPDDRWMVTYSRGSLVHFQPTSDLDAAKVRAATAANHAELTALGFAVEMCVVDLRATAEAVQENALSGGDFDCVMVGAGVRVPPENFLLFERIVNVVHRHAPRAVISFNANPGDTVEAARRSLTMGANR